MIEAQVPFALLLPVNAPQHYFVQMLMVPLRTQKDALVATPNVSPKQDYFALLNTANAQKIVSALYQMHLQ